jgi:hypothetical protein
VFHVSKGMKYWFRILGTLLVGVAAANGQRFEVTPLVGGMVGGTWKLEQQGVPNFTAHLSNGLSFGIAGGVRFGGEDGNGNTCEYCNSIGFRWVRQYSHLGLERDLVVPPAGAPSFHPAVTLDYFLADFAHEWTIEQSRKVNPYLVATLGAARTATPEGGTARFVFGLGTGVKVFPSRRWGIRFQAEYLPIVMWAELQRVVCTVGCVVALDGGLMERFQFSFGPVFRF